MIKKTVQDPYNKYENRSLKQTQNPNLKHIWSPDI